MTYPTFDKSLFQITDEALEIESGAVENPLAFDRDSYKVRFAIIKKTTFREKVVFDGVFLGIGIKFINCKFLKGIEFRNCTASGYDIQFSEDPASLCFQSGRNESIEISNCLFERGVIIDKGKAGPINFNNLAVNNGSIKFDSVNVSKQITITSCLLEDEDSELIFEKSTLGETVTLSDVKISGRLSFSNSTFQKHAFIFAGEFGSLTFQDGAFHEDVNLEGAVVKDTLAILGVDFGKTMRAAFKTSDREGSCNNIYIANAKCKRLLEVQGVSQPIRELTIVANSNLEGTYRFSHCQLLKTSLSGDNETANIRFTDCDFKNLSFSNFTNSSTLAFMGCKSLDNDSIFEAENSNFGKLELFNFLFSSFKKVTIADCLLSELVTTGVDWFDDKNLEVANNGRLHRNRREVYRQLKQVCEKQGDKIQALEFQTLELMCFRKEIGLKDKWYHELIVFKNTDRSKRLWYDRDRWILRFSYTNNYGLHWTKPLAWVLALTIIVFFPLIVAAASPELDVLPATCLHDWEVTCSVFWKHIDVLPQLFNPARLTTRMFPDIPENKLGFATHAWDGFQRVVLAFFIVQIVAAFRKYVRQ